MIEMCKVPPPGFGSARPGGHAFENSAQGLMPGPLRFCYRLEQQHPYNGFVYPLDAWHILSPLANETPTKLKEMSMNRFLTDVAMGLLALVPLNFLAEKTGATQDLPKAPPAQQANSPKGGAATP